MLIECDVIMNVIISSGNNDCLGMTAGCDMFLGPVGMVSEAMGGTQVVIQVIGRC